MTSRPAHIPAEDRHVQHQRREQVAMMTGPRVHALLLVMVFLSIAACAKSSQPAASVPQASPAWLAGEWQASGWLVGGAQRQFQRDTTVSFAPDGTWTAAAGGSGTSRMDGDRVVLDGVTADGTEIRYTLKQRQAAGGPELWGTVATRGGSTEVTLKKLR
jgi:hypothetical protein